MQNLINIENKDGKLLVSSREVAENFGKEHKNVLRDLEKLISSKLSSLNGLIIKNEYKDILNRTQKEYLLTRDGFSLLVMGFTGKKALDWKLRYIDAFNKMEQHIKENKKLSPMEQLRLQYESLEDHEERLSSLEDNMTVDFRQQRHLQNKGKAKAVEVLGGKESFAYKDRGVRSKVFSCIWRDFKDYFSIASYRDTPKKDFDKAMDYLEGWRPEGRLLRNIEDYNNMFQMFDLEIAATKEEM